MLAVFAPLCIAHIKHVNKITLVECWISYTPITEDYHQPGPGLLNVHLLDMQLLPAAQYSYADVYECTPLGERVL
jgi:hypothetical protein